MAIGARVLKCPNCGASLRWNGDVTVVECRYCQTHVAVESGRRTDRPTEAVSVVVPRRTMGLGVVVVSLLAVGGVGALTVVSSRRTAGSATATAAAETSTVAEVLATPLASTVAEVEARHRVRANGNHVMIKLADPAFQEVSLEWDAAFPDHVRAVMVRPRAGVDLGGVVVRARAQLGRRLRLGSGDSHQLGTLGNSFYLGTTLQVRANDLDHPGWKSQLEALWDVLAHAAFEAPSAIDDAVRRDQLDLGYPMELLMKLDRAVVVDDAAAAVHALAPNAVTDGANHRVQLDHPYFESATLSWDNAPGGRWTGLTLYFPVELKLTDLAGPLQACLAPVVGEPKKLVADHLAGTFTLQYAAKGGKPWINVSERVLSVSPHYNFGDPSTAEGLAAVLAALVSCGG